MKRDLVTISYERRPDGSWTLDMIEHPESLTAGQHQALEELSIAMESAVNHALSQEAAA